MAETVGGAIIGAFISSTKGSMSGAGFGSGSPNLKEREEENEVVTAEPDVSGRSSYNLLIDRGTK